MVRKTTMVLLLLAGMLSSHAFAVGTPQASSRPPGKTSFKIKPLGISSKNFGTVDVGSSQTSVTGEFEIYCTDLSTGNACIAPASIHINSITSNKSVFTIVNDGCTGQNVIGGGHCSFQVKFTPTAAGAVSGTITGTATTGTPVTWAVSGTGRVVTGPAPAPSPAPTSNSAPRVQAPICAVGSIVDVDNLTLGEEIPIVGSPFTLHYSSDRVAARNDLFQDQVVTIPFKSGSTSADIVLTTQPGGGTFTNSYTFPTGSTSDITFNRTFTVPSSVDSADLSYSLWIYYNPSGTSLTITGGYGGWQAKNVGIGGWTLSQHHQYKNSERRIYYGYGGSRYITEAATWFAGGYYAIASEDGSEVYLFDVNTQLHVGTKDANSGADKYTFAYYAGTKKLASVTDAWGNVTTIVRDSSGNATGIQAQNGQLTSLGFDSNGWLSTVTDPLNRSYLMTYGTTGLMQSFKKPGTPASYFTYNTDGTLKSDTGAFGTLVDLTKTLISGGWKIDVKNAMNRTDSHSITSNGLNSTRLSTMADGTTTNISNKPTGESVYAYPEGYTQTVKLEADSRFKWSGAYPSTTSKYVGNSVYGETTYTAIVNTLSSSTNIFSLVSKAIYTTVNGDGAKIWNTLFTAADGSYTTTSPVGVVTRVKVDSKGLPIELKPGNGVTYSFTYDSMGRLISEQLAGTTPVNLTTRTYDTLGRVATFADAVGNTTTYSYDLAGRVTKKTLPNLQEINYTYDDNDNVTSVYQTGRPSHTLAYNLLDYISSYLPPAIGGSNPPKTFDYGTDRQITKITNPDAGQINFNYNATTGLLSTISTANGNYSYSYKSGTTLVNGTSSPYGVNNSLTYLGPVLTTDSMTMDSPVGSQPLGTITTTYSPVMKVSAVKIAAGSGIQTMQTNYTYNNDYVPTKIGTESLTYVTGTNRLQRLDIGTTSSTTFTYSPGGNVLTYLAKFNTSTTMVDYAATRRADEKLASEHIQWYSNELWKNYEYDTAGRLKRVTNQFGNEIGLYSYDSNGNRVSTSGFSTVWPYPMISFASTYNAQDQMLTFGSLNYTYNTNGARATRTDTSTSETTTYTYDAVGNLATVTTPTATITYAYDARGRRVAKKVNGTFTNHWLYYDQTRIAATLDGSRQVIAYYVYGTRSNTPDYLVEPFGKAYQIFTNNIGSPIALVDPLAGARAVNTFSYTDFGAPGAMNSMLPLGFAGGLYDSDTKLYHFGARDYDPESGVWLQKDPIGLAGGDTNLYGYVNQDPVNLDDPFGLKTTLHIWGAFLSPSSWGGHASIEINGQSYSFGPNGMDTSPDYIRRQRTIRFGTAYDLDLSAEQENGLTTFMKNYSSKYHWKNNNCQSSISQGLNSVGISTQPHILPIGLGYDLMQSGYIKGSHSE